MGKYILAIDQGTTGTTTVIVNEAGQLAAKVTKEFAQIYPEPGWVEHEPRAIWDSVVLATKKVISDAAIDARQIAAIGITNQRETVVVWDKKTGEPVHNAIVWQDRRTAEFCSRLKKEGKEKTIKRHTGLVLDPYFSASKFRWILKNVRGLNETIKNQRLLGGTIDVFLLWHLTGGKEHKTDVSNGSRTQLMNIEEGNWDADLLRIFEIPRELLPMIVPSNGFIGETRGLDFLPDGIPITGMAGDQQAALFGQTCFRRGDAKCTFGTGSFLMLNTGKRIVQSKNGLLTTIAWQLKDERKITYALEGGAFVCGAAVQWLRDGLGVIDQSVQIEELAASVSDALGVVFVPALTGLGAPYWDPNAKGMIAGLTRGATKAHLARATLEGMALQNSDILLAMQKDLGYKIQALRVDGGAAANNLLMQMQCDFLGVPITRPSIIETTALGAAYLAGLGVDIWKDYSEIEKIWQIDKKFEGKLARPEQKKRLEAWHSAIKRTRFN